NTESFGIAVDLSTHRHVPRRTASDADIGYAQCCTGEIPKHVPVGRTSVFYSVRLCGSFRTASVTQSGRRDTSQLDAAGPPGKAAIRIRRAEQTLSGGGLRYAWRTRFAKPLPGPPRNPRRGTPA